MDTCVKIILFILLAVGILSILRIVKERCKGEMKDVLKKEALYSSIVVQYFFNPKCPHCRDFNPIWEEFVKQNQGKATFKKVDCSVESCNGIRGVPFVVFSFGGKTTTPYTGPRNVNSLNMFLNIHL